MISRKLLISKKLLSINIVVLILIFGIYIYGFGLLNPSIKIDFWYYLQECQLHYLLVSLAFLALVSWMISTLKIKNLNPKNKFLLVYTILCSLLLCFFAYILINNYIVEKKAITKSENEYLKQAKEDIKNDNVTFRFSVGLEMPIYDQKTYIKIDNVRKNYGIKYQNPGCTVDEIDIEGQKKYTETIKPYLEKRNGKGWKNRMKNEIEKLEKVELHN
ncbi:hypothetical protein QFZ37_003662 [Chryseobacterium ginsenosidimutans]|uniref:FEKKY domain-containing protein n=1 Tax=Chryseobacterium ginsenosidimutans TaxID=687846 RepID=UPI002785C974|nr:hypothetical protein [Chryseobacterium ginsenosidimutans]MDQ0595293.1 hypothetical protein [Chryseobacterium ginsenosidimutans]